MTAWSKGDDYSMILVNSPAKEKGTVFGDLSAILIDNMPFWAEFSSTPSNKVFQFLHKELSNNHRSQYLSQLLSVDSATLFFVQLQRPDKSRK